MNKELKQFLEASEPIFGLKKIAEEFSDRVVFSTSFSLEDQVITHFIAEEKLPVQIFTLDTGRLFPETYSTWERTLERYNISIRSYNPDSDKLENLIQKNGPNGFYKSIGNRKDCCQVRKVIPLKKALSGMRVWISGLRAEHSAQRESLEILEWSDSDQLFKYYPLLHFTEAQLRQIISSNGIPYNILFDKGFPSIGCAPCTRAIREGEPMRAGRWWWEDPNNKECGIHEKQSIKT